MDIRLGRSGLILDKGKLELTSSRGESLAQRLTVRLRTFFGSWFMDTEYGIDYFKRVFEKTIPQSSIDAVFQAEINKDERVAKITYFVSKIEHNVYYLKFKVKAKDGTVSEQVNIDISQMGFNIN